MSLFYWALIIYMKNYVLTNKSIKKIKQKLLQQDLNTRIWGYYVAREPIGLHKFIVS